MADMVTQKDIAALVTIRMASSFAQATAGGSGNAQAVTGTTFQRSTMDMPLNAALVLGFTANLAAGKTLYLGAVAVQTSVDGVNWSNWITFADPGVVATGPSGGGTVEAQVTLEAYLSGASDFVRIAFTPTLSATATDTATVAAVLVFAGFDRLPAAA